MRKLLAAAALTLAAMPASAHDFWIQPSRFVLEKPGAVPLNLYVGHGQARDRWGVSPDHVVLFKTLGPDGLIDRRAGLTLDASAADAVVPLREPGAYVFGLQSGGAQSTLPAVRFNEYVATEGIAPIAQYRRRRGEERAEGREIYSRRAKAIVQVGPVDAASVKRVTRPVGLLLEIVPGTHPLALGSDDGLPVKVLYRGRPLAGALVKLTDLAADAEPVAQLRTDAQGRARFRIAKGGDYQMNVVWSEPLANQAKADFKTVFSSLSFAARQ